MKQRRIHLNLILLLLAGACVDITDPAGRPQQGRVACAADSAQFANLTAGNLNEIFAHYAAVVPGGFGGFYINGGNYEFRLKDMSQASEAATTLTQLTGKGPFVAVQGDYDFLELYGCFLAAVKAGVTGLVVIDADEYRNRVVIGVSDAAQVATAQARLASAGLPMDIFVIQHVGVVCTMEARGILGVTVTDSITGAPITNGLSGYVVDGPTRWEMHASNNALYPPVYERPGSYDVTVNATGYQQKKGVVVELEPSGCHIKPVVLQAKLSR